MESWKCSFLIWRSFIFLWEKGWPLFFFQFESVLPKFSLMSKPRGAWDKYFVELKWDAGMIQLLLENGSQLDIRLNFPNCPQQWSYLLTLAWLGNSEREFVVSIILTHALNLFLKLESGLNTVLLLWLKFGSNLLEIDQELTYLCLRF